MSKKAIVGLILLGIFLFLWFEVRPAVIYWHCAKLVEREKISSDEFGQLLINEYREKGGEKFIQVMKKAYDAFFERCVRRYGINP